MCHGAAPVGPVDKMAFGSSESRPLRDDKVLRLHARSVQRHTLRSDMVELPAVAVPLTKILH